MIGQQNVQTFLLRHGPIDKIFLPDKFCFRRDRGWVWLQRLALFVLRKIGAFSWEEKVSVWHVPIDGNRLLNNILAQHSEIMATYNLRGDRLLMGPRELFQLLEEEPLNIYHPLAFEVNYYQHVNGEVDYYGTREEKILGYTVAGLRVVVIPWMTGMLVVPKLDD